MAAVILRPLGFTDPLPEEIGFAKLFNSATHPRAAPERAQADRRPAFDVEVRPSQEREDVRERILHQTASDTAWPSRNEPHAACFEAAGAGLGLGCRWGGWGDVVKVGKRRPCIWIPFWGKDVQRHWTGGRLGKPFTTSIFVPKCILSILTSVFTLKLMDRTEGWEAKRRSKARQIR